MSKPNILYIMSDQHRFDSLACNGHPMVKTPNMDRLAASGCNFTNAFTPLPMCVPVRCTLLTGQWPSQHGVIHNFDGECFKPLDPQGPSVPREITGVGYHSHHFGRWHVSPNHSPLDFGFQEYTPDWRYGKWRQHQGIAACPRDGGVFGNNDPHITPEQSSVAWHADQIIECIEKSQGEPDPFFIRWHMIEPHLPCRPPQEYADMYDPKDIEPWPGFADEFINKPYMHKHMNVSRGTDGMCWDDWAPVVARYFAEISLLDTQIGKLLDALERLGIADNTLIVYTADHGDMCGSHGMIDKHCVMYDDIVRIPLMMSWPNQIQAGSVSDEFVNLVDIPSTMCVAAGIEVPEYCAGLNLIDIANGKSSDREDIFSTYHGNQFGNYSQRMVRDRRWKYVWNAGDIDELYDLENDPGELTNLLHEEQHAEELQRLRTRLVYWLEETNDVLNNPSVKKPLLSGAIYDGR
ncbi:MAG: sulfatase-like hydrolase/transferase [Planctomycetes bacterium]|nr:sulfatase-like hydrolase/transferase [Planctomycetota bacterium]